MGRDLGLEVETLDISWPCCFGGFGLICRGSAGGIFEFSPEFSFSREKCLLLASPWVAVLDLDECVPLCFMMPLALGRDTAMEPSWALQATCCSARASGPSYTPLFTLNGQLTTGPILATDIKIHNGYFVTSWWPVDCLGERREYLGGCKLGSHPHGLSTENL